MSAEPTTFHDLYTRYSGDVYRFAYWLTGNVDDAKDVTSETFVRVWTSSSEIRTQSVKAYLFTICRRLFLNQLRRKGTRTPLDEQLPDGAIPIDEAVAVKDDLRRTLEALATLPEIDRAVLLMRAEEDLSYEDIAIATGLSVTAAKVKVFRARAKLSKLLGRTEGDLS
jgi:RNA polymerase sigma-70 factor, ECF subfamily